MSECFGRLAGGFCRGGREMKKPAQISKRRPDKAESDGAEISSKAGPVGFTLGEPYSQHSFYLAARIRCKTHIVRVVIIDDSVRTRPDPRTALLYMKKHISHLRPLIFTTIPKACGFEAATRFTSILSGGSLIPIVVHRDGDDFFLGKRIQKLNSLPIKLRHL